MKKLVSSIMTALLLLALAPVQLSAAVKPISHSTPINSSPESARAEVLLNRLDEINAIDKSELNRSEKKALRQEVREMKHELKAQTQGVYLSAGAIIIIVLLLILLL